MKVKDIILRALVFAGRDDVAKAVEEADDDLDGCDSLIKEAVKIALLCFNAVEDELARCYLPLKTTERFVSDNGDIKFSLFSERPIRILSVKNAAGECDFETLPEKLKTSVGEVYVEYNYAPQPKGLEDESVYSETQASISLIAAGTASEFCLISGDAGAANVWETRYRQEIDLCQRKKYSGVKIPPRRWV